MSIKGEIDELESISIEIKRLNVRKKELTARKKILEKNIVTFLDKNGHSGIKYKGKAILPKESYNRQRRKKKDKEEQGKNVLRNYGINGYQATNLLKELSEALKGEKQRRKTLKISKLDK